MRLIDGDGIGLALAIRGHHDKRFGWGDIIRYTPSEVQQIINEDIPIVDAVKVLHGRWTHSEGDSRWMCSVCKCKEHAPTIMGKPIVWDYCPNCGARMENGKDTE